MAYATNGYSIEPYTIKEHIFDERYEIWIGHLENFDKKGTDKRLENRLNQAISKIEHPMGIESRVKIVDEKHHFGNSRLTYVYVRLTTELAFLELLKPDLQLRFDGFILKIRKSKRIAR